jgi:3-methyladenine DNA glycosylase AlkC
MTAPPPRKGAKRVAEVPPEIREQLNRGEIAAVNLMECLAIDMAQLLRHALPELSAAAIATLHHAGEAKMGWVSRTRLAAAVIYQECYPHEGTALLSRLQQHPSDGVRGWAAGVIAHIPAISLAERLNLVRPFADDTNANVREVAWLMLRERVAENITESLALLHAWASEPSPNLRRYASEITRPRGVWCCHIPALKENPALALPLLMALQADSARYVQLSVGNWLNDAAKSQPNWVWNLTEQWLQHAEGNKATLAICKRARRSLC